MTPDVAFPGLVLDRGIMKLWKPLLAGILLSLVVLSIGCSAKDYSVTIAVSGQGSTNPAAGSYIYEAGSPLHVTAIPASGWKFDGWSGDATGAEPSVSLKVEGKQGMTATFSKVTYKVSLAVDGSGSTTPRPGDGVYDSGTTVNVTAVPAAGWKFDHWSGDASGTSPAIAQLIDGNKSLTAKFTRVSYILTLAVDGSGTIDPPVGGHSYDAGTPVNLTAVPAKGWKFDKWTGSVTDAASASTTVTMKADSLVTAIFTKTTFGLTVAVNGNGTVDPGAGSRIYDAGALISLTATPAAGWQFTGWSGDFVSARASDSLKLDGNKNVTANFSRSPYMLVMKVVGFGTVVPSTGGHVYESGTVVSVQAIAADGWRFSRWVGDVTQPLLAATTVTVNSDKSVEADFVLARQSFGPYTLNIGTASGDLAVPGLNAGDRVEFTFNVTGAQVYYSARDAYGNIVLTGSGGGKVMSGSGSFVAASAGDYKLHFESGGIISGSNLGVGYTVYYAG